jgi:hypothetical protein
MRAVAAQVAAVKEALREHIAVTEGPSGRYSQLLRDAPRLAPGIDTLITEHTELMAALDEVGRDGDPEVLRRQAADLVERLGRHRQLGADLIYEAYAIDVGGET